MQASYLKCTFCLQDFNKERRTPYILVECGHSICQRCLSLNTGKQCSFECPEDQSIINCMGKTVKDFPKNMALLNMITQVNEADSYNSYKHSDSYSQMQSRNSKTISDKMMRSNTLNSIQSANRKSICRQKTLNSNKIGSLKKHSDSDSEYDESPEEVCMKHQKRLEVICMEPECQVKVCYQCGLFGEHSVS